MPKFPIKVKNLTNKNVKIYGDDYNHIIKVLRLKEGDEITLFDQSSIDHIGIINKINTKEVVVNILESVENRSESHLDINLLQGIPKGNKMDLIVQKSTELGVKSITPVLTERTIAKTTDKISRWKKIALESCKQCGRTKTPEVNKQNNFESAFSLYRDSDLKIILYEEYKETLNNYLKNKKKLPRTTNILIGPEGGFTKREIDLAEENGYVALGLGPRILRTETASIAVVSILQHLFGDL